MACTGQLSTDASLTSLVWPFSNIKGDGNTVFFFLGVFTEPPKPLSSGEHFPQGFQVPESGSAWGLSTMLGLVQPKAFPHILSQLSFQEFNPDCEDMDSRENHRGIKFERLIDLS